jgi:hypothetical protein
MLTHLGCTEKYMKADENTKEQVDNILSSFSGVDLTKVDEILKIVQSEVFVFTSRLKEGVKFN